MNNTKNPLKNFIKKMLPLGITFLIVGIFICAIGLSMAHFDFKNLQNKEPAKWYQTVQIEESGFSVGIHVGDDTYITGLHF